MRCCDFPACGHEAGCCPDFDESGRQLNMICVCGKVLPITNRYSICDSCLNADSDYESDYEFDDELQENEDFAHDNEMGDCSDIGECD